MFQINFSKKWILGVTVFKYLHVAQIYNASISECTYK